jgi:hypothetical protein
VKGYIQTLASPTKNNIPAKKKRRKIIADEKRTATAYSSPID